LPGLAPFPTRRSSDLTVAAVLAVVAALALLALRVPGTALIAGGLVIAGAIAGQARLHAIDGQLAAARHTGHAHGRAILLEHPRRSEEHTSELQSRENL